MGVVEVRTIFLFVVLIYQCSALSIPELALNTSDSNSSTNLLNEATSLLKSHGSPVPNFDISKISPVRISLPGGGSLELSTLYWPIQQLCPRAGSIGTLGCFNCSNDCTFLHNRRNMWNNTKYFKNGNLLMQ